MAEAVPQQNAALVEQAAGAAGSLREQAEHLVDIVGIFKTADALPAGHSPEASRPARAPIKKASASNLLLR